MLSGTEELNGFKGSLLIFGYSLSKMLANSSVMNTGNVISEKPSLSLCLLIPIPAIQATNRQ